MNPVNTFSFSLLFFSSCVFLKASVIPENPNIVFVLADDLGIGDLGCYGQKKIKTPNLDQLAAHSLIFENHYSGSSVSAPSRCSLLTGLHTGLSSVRGNVNTVVDGEDFDLPLLETDVTIAQLLKEKGYKTMCVGKWGLGGPNSSGSPSKKGFDYFFGYLSQKSAHRYYPEYLYENSEKVYLNNKVYSHHLIVEKGLEFISNCGEDPFFAYFAITPPHADLDYPDLNRYGYDGKFVETQVPLNNPHFKKQDKPKATYASMVSEIDENVGRIIQVLKEKNLWDNTIFIFSSDNGVHCEGGHDPVYFNSNGGLRGFKRDLYEGGIRTPFILSWPKKIKAQRKTEHLSAFWDFFPTIAHITGIPIKENTDAISYYPTILGDSLLQKQHDYLYFEFYPQGGKQAIIAEDGWKLVRLNVFNKKKTQEELFYLPDDKKEVVNRIYENKAIADSLRQIARDVRRDNFRFNWRE